MKRDRSRKKSASTAIRRMISLCLIVVFVFVWMFPASAAESAAAADMRLEGIEGTVALENAGGAALSARTGMKLYSGYTLSTKAASYAYVSLDRSKVIKLDANSQVEVRKQGQKLELLVKAGQLFFNVRDPLSASESMNIRTSTAVTGVRGTSGYVTVEDSSTSSVTILDGVVGVTTLDMGVDGNFCTTQVAAGQTGVVSPKNADSWQVQLQTLSAADVPGFVAVELQQNPELQQRVAQDSNLPVDEIAANAQERLRQDELQAAQEQNSIDAASAKLSNHVVLLPGSAAQGTDSAVGPLRLPTNGQEPEEDERQGWGEAGQDTATDSSAGSGTGQIPEPTPEPEAEYTVSSGNITASQLQSYLDQYDTVTIRESAIFHIEAGETVTVAAGKTFNDHSSSNSTNGGTLNIEGTFNNDSIVYNNGSIVVSGVLNNNSTLHNDSNITVNAGGTVNIASGYAYMTNSATLTNNGTIVNNASSTEKQGTPGLNNTGVFTNNGTFTNNGDFYNGNGDSQPGTLINAGAFTNTGFIKNYQSSILTNNGSYSGSGTVEGNGTFDGTSPIS